MQQQKTNEDANKTANEQLKDMLNEVMVNSTRKMAAAVQDTLVKTNQITNEEVQK